jgi:uncharacterized membrane protein YkvA (DUF1232 family)
MSEVKIMDKPRGISTRLGVFQGFTNQIRLIGKLMADHRVSPLLKLLPVGALIYLVVPTDLMPLLPFDDAAVLWIGATLFLELCPQDVVREHRLAIEQGNSTVIDANPQAPAKDVPPAADIVDGEFYDVSGSDRKP